MRVASRSPAPSAKRGVALLDEPRARTRVAVERALGQELRRPSTGRGALGQARAARRADTASAADSAADVRSATTGPTTTGPGANCAAHRFGGNQRVADAVDDDDQPVALDGADHVEPGGLRGAAPRCRRPGRRRRRGQADDDGHLPALAPAERGGPRRDGLVYVTAQEGVDDEGLEPGVPGASGLGGLRVDLSGGEGDLAGVEEYGLTYELLVARLGQLVGAVLDDADRGADELDGLLEGDRAGQLAGRRAEDVGRDREPRSGVAEPLDERRDACLGDQPDPAPLVGRHVAVPRQRLVHPLDRVGREAGDRALEPAYGRRPVVRHASSVGRAVVDLPQLPGPRPRRS